MRKCLSAWVMALLVAGCGRPSGQAAVPRARPLPGGVLADSAPGTALPPARPLAGPRTAPLVLGVSPSRDPAAGAIDAPPAEPPAPAGVADRLPVDDRLRPPVPRGDASLRVPGGAGRWVILDVRIDEAGAVTDAEPAGGNADPATVRAACRAVRATRYYAARLAGRPVAVWTRQRFDLTR